MMKKRTEKEILRRQLELLAEESKDTCPASNELSSNSLAMAEISKELFKRKWFSAILFITLYYFIVRFTVRPK